MLQEEQRRILQGLESDALVWDQQALLARSKECPILQQGAIAYAAWQANLRRVLANQFATSWRTLLTSTEPSRNRANAEFLKIVPDSDNEDEMNLLKKHDSDDQ